MVVKTNVLRYSTKFYSFVHDNIRIILTMHYEKKFVHIYWS